MLRSRWRKFWARFSQRDGDLDREIQSHLDLAAEEQGRDAASRAFGNATRIKEDIRETWSLTWLERLLQDLRYGLRQLRKDPGFAALVILTVALGIGASTAVFSLVNAVLIRSLPYGDPARLVYILTPNARFPQLPLGAWSPTYADFFDIQRQTHSFSRMALFTTNTVNLANETTVDRVNRSSVTADFFPTLEAAPEFGRTIEPDDDQPGHGHVAVISHQIWQSKFGGDP